MDRGCAIATAALVALALLLGAAHVHEVVVGDAPAIAVAEHDAAPGPCLACGASAPASGPVLLTASLADRHLLVRPPSAVLPATLHFEDHPTRAPPAFV